MGCMCFLQCLEQHLQFAFITLQERKQREKERKEREKEREKEEKKREKEEKERQEVGRGTMHDLLDPASDHLHSA